MTRKSPFHAGELDVQTRSGVRERAELLGNMFRPFLPDQYSEFYAQLPFLLVGSLDGEGQPWASMLIGPLGFVRSPDPETLLVLGQPAAGDPLQSSLREGAPLGLLGIQLETRRRNRVNGHIGEVGARGFSLHVDQSFGNCPKYIQARKLELAPRTGERPAPRLETARLSDAAVSCIGAADTCFIASASARQIAEADPREGVDVSHRGGKPGFVRVDRDDSGTTLLMPDFAGNNAFNTLGNLARYPRAGLLFPDFERGDVVSIACETQIHYAGHMLALFRGAERMLSFRVLSGLYFPQFMPFRWTPPEPGPHIERTGRW